MIFEKYPASSKEQEPARESISMKKTCLRIHKLREKVILSVFGSPDIRQIDGLGGADPLTSKVAIIGPSKRDDADVNYTMGQVSINEAFVDFSGTAVISPPVLDLLPSMKDW